MGAMIGGVAHELNNPLTSILGVSELLQDSQTTDSARKQIGILQQQARRAAEIVHNLTYFATPPTPGKTRVNLWDVVERTLNLHAYSLRKNNITVDFVREPGLPYVQGDPHQLMQVFLNLVMNAEQAIREARDRGTLRIRLGTSGESVWASFLDDGPGIPARRPGQHLRSVLYDEASGARDRPWAQHLQIGHEGTQRSDRSRERARRRSGVYRYSACGYCFELASSDF